MATNYFYGKIIKFKILIKSTKALFKISKRNWAYQKCVHFDFKKFNNAILLFFKKSQQFFSSKLFKIVWATDDLPWPGTHLLYIKDQISSCAFSISCLPISLYKQTSVISKRWWSGRRILMPRNGLIRASRQVMPQLAPYTLPIFQKKTLCISSFSVFSGHLFSSSS